MSDQVPLPHDIIRSPAGGFLLYYVEYVKIEFPSSFNVNTSSSHESIAYNSKLILKVLWFTPELKLFYAEAPYPKTSYPPNIVSDSQVLSKRFYLFPETTQPII